MELVQWHMPDPWHQQLEATNVAGKTTLVLVFQYKLRRRLLECPWGPYAIDLCLTRFLCQPREKALGFFEPIRSSALANSPSADVLVDVPHFATFDETWCFLSSHK